MQLAFKYRRLLQGLEPIPPQSNANQELLAVTANIHRLSAHPNWQAGIQVWQGDLQQQIEAATPENQSAFLQIRLSDSLFRLKDGLLEINTSTADLYWLLKTLTDLRGFLRLIPTDLHTQCIQFYQFDDGWNILTQYHKWGWFWQTAWCLVGTHNLEVAPGQALQRKWYGFIDDAKRKMDTILQKHPITNQKRRELLGLFSTAVCSLFPRRSNTGPLQQWLQRRDVIPFADAL